MYMPLVRECVRVEGRNGLFMVLRADYKRHCADLMGVSNKEQLTGISFTSLFANGEAPEPQLEGAGPRSC